jgi:site-specific recombinase XerD
MSSLRQRMIEDMRIRNFSAHTEKAYVKAVARFAKYFHRSPRELGPEHIRRFQRHLVRDCGLSPSSLNIVTCALRFLYRVTLNTPFDIERIPFARGGRKLPVVLSPDEIRRFFACISMLKYRAVFMTMYASGLRVSEALRLRIADVDSARQVLRVHQGKGKKDRYTLLPDTLLQTLRDYWRRWRPKTYLFEGATPDRPLQAGTFPWSSPCPPSCGPWLWPIRDSLRGPDGTRTSRPRLAVGPVHCGQRLASLLL